MEPVIPHKEELREGLRLIKWALEEDLSGGGERTSTLLIDQEKIGRANIVARQSGTVAGIDIARNVFHTLDPSIQCKGNAVDGDRINTADVLMEIEGNIRTMLSVERVALNFLTHLSGIATLTAQFVAAVSGTKAQIFDTRKTIPGWRRLAKYAVRAGGGNNHRINLADGAMIKDNHLAAMTHGTNGENNSDVVPLGEQLTESIIRLREKLPKGIPIVVEVDHMAQYKKVLPICPDIVLLDNMELFELRQAVQFRNELASKVCLEATGGITLKNIQQVALTGVERISVGALTHSSSGLDMAMDWVH